MSTEYLNYRFLVRGGTAANLAAVNEVPLARELIIETDTLKWKLGNGSTAYNALPYGGGSGGGSVWRDGAGVPSNSLGNNGDYYLRTSNGDVYVKAAGAYTVVGNIKGAPGATGPAGATGATGATGAAGPPGPSSACFPTASFDGGLSDIILGSFVDLYVPFGFNVTAWTLVAGQNGQIEIDVRVADYANHPPGSLDTICGPSRPKITAGNKNQDLDLSDWDAEIASGSCIRFIVTACTGIRRATLTMTGVRS